MTPFVPLPPATASGNPYVALGLLIGVVLVFACWIVPRLLQILAWIIIGIGYVIWYISRRIARCKWDGA